MFGLIEGQTYGWWLSIKRLDLLGWPVGAISPVPVAFALAIASMAAFVLIERARLRAVFSVYSFTRGTVRR